MIAEGDVSSSGTATLNTRYVYGHGIAFQMDAFGQKAYYFTNGHGDVVELRTANGLPLNKYEYDIWGNTVSLTEARRNLLRYSGEYWDDATGLQYLRARWYDPSIGRFITEDTYEGELTNSLSLNLYTYVLNNPLKYIDPSGHFCVSANSEYMHIGGCNGGKSGTDIHGDYNGSRYIPDDWFKEMVGITYYAESYTFDEEIFDLYHQYYQEYMEYENYRQQVQYETIRSMQNFMHDITGYSAFQTITSSSNPTEIMLAATSFIGPRGPNGNIGKSRNKPKQSGIPNSTEFIRGSDGKVSKYSTFGDRGQLVKEVRITGKGHDNIPRPNVKEPIFNINPKTGQKFQNGYRVRPAEPFEIPKR